MYNFACIVYLRLLFKRGQCYRFLFLKSLQSCLHTFALSSVSICTVYTLTVRVGFVVSKELSNSDRFNLCCYTTTPVWFLSNMIQRLEQVMDFSWGHLLLRNCVWHNERSDFISAFLGLCFYFSSCISNNHVLLGLFFWKFISWLFYPVFVFP